MADDSSDRDQRTEPPSQRRLQRARDEGQIALGRDAVAVGAVAGGVGALVILAPRIAGSLVSFFAAAMRGVDGDPADLAAMCVEPTLWMLVPVATAALGAAIAALAQTRGGVWPELAMPDGERLFSFRGLTRLFGREPWEDLLLSTVKVVAIGGVVWLALRDDLLTLPRLLQLPASDLLRAAFAPLGSAALKVLGIMLVLAGLELALSRHRFLSRMRMTKEELKRELKEDEGDPLLRGQRKRRHRELARARAAVEVPRADALVVNPTHVAVAIRYRAGEGRAPRVTAKGKGKLAEIMRDLAREHGVPIVEDIALARLLHRRVKVGREVPASTYKAVAAILAYVYRVTGRRAA